MILKEISLNGESFFEIYSYSQKSSCQGGQLRVSKEKIDIKPKIN